MIYFYLCPKICDIRYKNRSFNDTYLKVNDIEAAYMSGIKADTNESVSYDEASRAAEILYERRGKPVFVTCGSSGSLAIDSSGLVKIPGIIILGRVDPVGAGDSYLAGAAAALAAGYNVGTAGNLGSLVAGVTVQKLFQTGTASPLELLELGKDPDYILEPELAEDIRKARYLENTDIEIVNNWDESQQIKYAIFDHDGTISTLREGWEEIMAPMMIKAILEDSCETVDKVVYERGRHYAEIVFDLLQKYCVDTIHGGYFEMFQRDWELCDPGSQGGDRKTLDVHMHLMEAFTTLYECTGLEVHKRKLLEIIDLILTRIIHPKYKTGIPQFFKDWSIAPQIKFDIIWGWDRFSEDGQKGNATDNTAYGHNAEFAWLLLHAFDELKTDSQNYSDTIRTILDHTVDNGIYWEYGGVFVEGPHSGGVYDREKEFWQQAEVLIALLDGYLMFQDEKYLKAYENVHRFVFDKVINKGVGEWYPLLSRKGEPIWTHMSHSWKINYHTVRAMVQSIQKLEAIERL